MDSPMLLPARRGSRPLVLTPWQRAMNAIGWLAAAALAQPLLAWDHLRSLSWRHWLALPGHLLHFALHALMALWMGSILLAAVGVLLCIPVACAGILYMLASKALGLL